MKPLAELNKYFHWWLNHAHCFVWRNHKLASLTSLLNNHHINITAGGGGSNIEGDIDWQDENFKLPPSVGGALGVGGWSRSNMKGDIDLQRKKRAILIFKKRTLNSPSTLLILTEMLHHQHLTFNSGGGRWIVNLIQSWHSRYLTNGLVFGFILDSKKVSWSLEF